MREIIISSIAEYINEINTLRDEGFIFFRGQDSYEKQKLLPSLLRQRFDESSKKWSNIYSKQCDQKFMNEFKSRAVSCMSFIPQNDWEWMSTAQHYGLPTRLLDWSQSALVALFFAVENEEFVYEEQSQDGPVVWCIDPIKLNEKLRFIEEYNIIPNIIEDNERFQSGLKEKYGIAKMPEDVIYPVAVICPTSNRRINAQKGSFTLFPLKALPIPFEDMEGVEELLCKIVIDKNLKTDIKRQLYEIGITYSTIYPDLDYICKDIKYDYMKNN
jgi:hypothetical protein